MPSLYVHVPFCVKKCNYCAFYSEPLQRSKVEGYLTSLNREADLRQQKVQEGMSTLFIGGGTPTALNEEELDTLLSIINSNFKFKDSAEKTMEANPGTLTTEKLQTLRKQGINRVSLGVQSLNDDLLRQIGRIHRSEEVKDAVRLIREAGFKNLNLDLMFGLPGQNLADWRDTLEETLRIRPEHISVYGLMVEEGTPIALNKELIANLPDDDTQAELYHLTREILGKAGYQHYEISNYALPGYECQHNLGYWRRMEYLGIGPGAVSCLKNRRFKNFEDIFLYEKMLSKWELPVDSKENEFLSKREQMVELLILGLRLKDGINLPQFKNEYGADLFELYPAVLERYLKAGVLRIEDGSLLLKPEYWFVANGVLQEFV
ncbi:putative oxygen-independent coproporphyrinogen III oxidase [Desulfitobacterium dehalogenans ATCC 51507]|uniref:Heme chaperone HemW n=1 Tax=Desulfitobacterium dehalogenans (strain ATCC 51507 / DSM 9161 / JW/IU-DC1) TaxID=756499 RepID=I4ADA9_DESDJ|nr:radical SAM family heme chaperone HemW [Desulfitobacterium dehalogenans]AFM01944.1 putative oxygen-independent coproporphyrinogen III oxidase [Desulfitobacterium dehalogenans ATCC 51507]